MQRAATLSDIKQILSLVGSLNMFEDDEITEIEERLDSHFKCPDDSIWLVYEGNGIEGLVYCAPEVMTKGTWNILMLLVQGDAQGKGYGQALVGAIQEAVTGRNGRLLIVETSGTDDFEKARRFYLRCGFIEAARIADFYDVGSDKVVFSKNLLI